MDAEGLESNICLKPVITGFFFPSWRL